MPMLHTPKPRQFHYEPRFYDPKKEEWERKKAKYAMEQAAKERREEKTQVSADLAYFEQRVRDIDRKERQKKSKFSFSDLFRKKEMPTFNYKPRFGQNATEAPSEAGAATSEGEAIMQRMRSHKIRRRFDFDDEDYFEPADGKKIILYVGVVFLLLLWILL